MIEKILTLIIFIACYSLAISRKAKLAYISLASAGLLILLGIVSPQGAFGMIQWDVLGIYWGFMMVSMIFMESGMPALIAHRVVKNAGKEKYAILALCLLTALVSSFMENVATVLIMAPIAIETAKRLKSDLFRYMIAIAISSNVVTTMTMVADPPSLIMAISTGMKFFDFYWFQGRLGLGVITLFGVAAAMLTLAWMFRKMNKPVKAEKERIKVDYVPTAVFAGGVIALVAGHYAGFSPGIIGLAVGLVSLAVGRRNLRKMVVKDFDWNSFIFITGIFVVIGSVQATGLLSDFVNLIGGAGVANASVMLAIIIWTSVAASSFIDNVPYTVLMIPVCSQLAALAGVSPFPFIFGMLIGTGIGGNITPVGATANVYACGILEKNACKVRLKDYLKMSVPFSVVAVLVAHVLLQLIWM